MATMFFFQNFASLLEEESSAGESVLNFCQVCGTLATCGLRNTESRRQNRGCIHRLLPRAGPFGVTPLRGSWASERDHGTKGLPSQRWTLASPRSLRFDSGDFEFKYITGKPISKKKVSNAFHFSQASQASNIRGKQGRHLAASSDVSLGRKMGTRPVDSLSTLQPA